MEVTSTPTKSRPRPTQRTLIRGDGLCERSEHIHKWGEGRWGWKGHPVSDPAGTTVSGGSHPGHHGREPPIRQRWYSAKSLAEPSQNAMTHARHIRSKITAKHIFIMGDSA